MTEKRTIYCAGPMTGYEDFNFPAFFDAERDLKELGWEPVSPARHDLDVGAVFLKDDKYHMSPEFDLAATLLWDLEQVARVDAIYMLSGWEKSKGALAEISLAKALGKEIMYEVEPGEFISNPTLTSADPHEVRITSATGGQKGSKEQRYDLIPTEPLRLLATLYGRGAAKYAERNWEKGYDWHLSFASAQRHMWSFWGGEDIDPEMGIPHPIAAVFHMFGMTEFLTTHPELDDRVKP